MEFLQFMDELRTAILAIAPLQEDNVRDIILNMIVIKPKLCSIVSVATRGFDHEFTCGCEHACGCLNDYNRRKNEWARTYSNCFTLCRDCFFVADDVVCQTCYAPYSAVPEWAQPQYFTWKDFCKSVELYPFAFSGSDIWTEELLVVTKMPFELVHLHVMNQKNDYSASRSINNLRYVKGRDFIVEEKEHKARMSRERFLYEYLEPTQMAAEDFNA
jgi:hypothetical protein